jgi:outer membrane immunogenic protein
LASGPITSASADDGAARRSWTGPYIGAFAGGASLDEGSRFSGDAQIVDFYLFSNRFGSAHPESTSDDARSGLVGVKAGYNVQSGSIVFGLEADLARVHLGTESTPSSQIGGNLQYETRERTEVDTLGTLRARVGLLATPDLLLFATGGLAAARVHDRLTLGFTNARTFSTGFENGASSLVCVNGTECLAGASAKTDVGWTIGGGAEVALTSNLTLSGEYLFVDLGGHSVKAQPANIVNGRVFFPTNSVGTSDVFLQSNKDLELHVLRLGLNYRF